MNEFLGLAAIKLMPMFGASSDAGPFELAPLLIAAVLWLVGLLWIRRSIDPGPLARGDAKWRYRDRDRTEGITTALDTASPPDRTLGWWLARVEFAIAIGLPVVLAWLLISAPPYMGEQPSQLTLPTRLAGFAGIAFGLAWMVRIYRAALRNDSEATWRYRDRQS